MTSYYPLSDGLIFIVFLTLSLPFAIIFYARLIVPLHLHRRWRLLWGFIIVIVFGACAIAVPLTLRIAKHPHIYNDLHLDIFLPLAYYAITFLCLLFVTIMIRDIVAFSARCLAFFREKSKPITVTANNSAPNDPHPPGPTLSRRRFLRTTQSAGLSAAALLLTPPAAYYAKSHRIVKRVTIKLDTIPTALNGLRIAHLSDIHLGNTITTDDVANIVRETMALSPDIIAITGDIADGMPNLIGHGLDPLRHLHAPYGVYFVTGNHDHMWDGAGWCQVIQNLGIHVLNNEHVSLTINAQPMIIAGVIDFRGDRINRSWKSSPQKALQNTPPNVFKLMLVHQPASIDPSFSYGADLVLAGHTHGGQFWPLSILIHAIHHYAHGLYYVGPKAAFVSAGTGYWGPPLRFGVPAEIGLITLQSGASYRR